MNKHKRAQLSYLINLQSKTEDVQCLPVKNLRPRDVGTITAPAKGVIQSF